MKLTNKEIVRIQEGLKSLAMVASDKKKKVKMPWGLVCKIFTFQDKSIAPMEIFDKAGNVLKRQYGEEVFVKEVPTQTGMQSTFTDKGEPKYVGTGRFTFPEDANRKAYEKEYEDLQNNEIDLGEDLLPIKLSTLEKFELDPYTLLSLRPILELDVELEKEE